MMTTPSQSHDAVQAVEFAGARLVVAEIKGVPYVALKPICEHLGLDWSAQYRRVMRDHVLSEGVAVMAMPSFGGVQDTLLLPLDMLNGWLFGVSEHRAKIEARELIIHYKRECYRVLAAHFLSPTPQEGPDALPADMGVVRAVTSSLEAVTSNLVKLSQAMSTIAARQDQADGERALLNKRLTRVERKLDDRILHHEVTGGHAALSLPAPVMTDPIRADDHAWEAQRHADALNALSEEDRPCLLSITDCARRLRSEGMRIERSTLSRWCDEWGLKLARRGRAVVVNYPRVRDRVRWRLEMHGHGR